MELPATSLPPVHWLFPPMRQASVRPLFSPKKFEPLPRIRQSYIFANGWTLEGFKWILPSELIFNTKPPTQSEKWVLSHSASLLQNWVLSVDDLHSPPVPPVTAPLTNWSKMSHFHTPDMPHNVPCQRCHIGWQYLLCRGRFTKRMLTTEGRTSWEDFRCQQHWRGKQFVPTGTISKKWLWIWLYLEVFHLWITVWHLNNIFEPIRGECTYRENWWVGG